MDIATPANATTITRGKTRHFHVWMAGTCLIIAILGFMPTFFVPVAQGAFTGEPVVYIHAFILYAWVTLYFTQTWLVARGRVAAHRSWGMLGIAIVTSMVFIVTWIISMHVSQASQPGQPPGMAHAVRAFEWVSFSGLMLYLLPIFTLAIVMVKRPDIHKRLMLLFTTGLMGAPIARWFFVLLAPPPVPGAPPSDMPPPPSVAIAPELVGDLLVIAAMIHDWRTRGRPHPVYVIGLAYGVCLQVSVTPFAESSVWQSVAAAIGHLAG